MLSVVVLVACLAGTTAIHCEGDNDLEDVQSFTQQVQNAGDMDYWRTRQKNFQAYGRFDGDPSDAVVTAGYYTANDNLIYGISVNCGAGTWKSLVTDDENEDADVVKTFKHGSLDTACVDGEEFDIFLKITQPYLMNWAFDGQAMQYGLDTLELYQAYRIRPHKVPSKYNADQAAYFKMEGTGSAKFTRFSWGQCNTWPHSIANNCLEARNWVLRRSKLPLTAQGLGQFGQHLQLWYPTCFAETRYYSYVQTRVHPDRNSTDRGFLYCCCANMETGDVILNGDGTDMCALIDDGSCSLECQGDIDILIEIQNILEHGDGK